MSEDLAQIIDLIYLAALRLDTWPDLLQMLAAMAGSEGAHVFAIRGDHQDFVSSPSVAHVAELYEEQAWPARTDRALRIFAHPERRFLVDPDVYSLDELRTEPVYHEFLIPIGMGRGAATGMRTTTGDRIVVNVERDYARGVVEPEVLAKLDFLRPHLGRSILLASQFGLSSWRERTESFQAIGLPAAVISSTGRLLSANGCLLELMPDIVRDGVEGLSFAHAGAQAAFREALLQLAASGPEPIPSLHVPATEAHSGHIGYIIPMRREASEVFSGAAATVLLSPIRPRRALSADTLEAVFGLSPAEARTARLVAEGWTLEAASRLTGVSRETLRVQLKRVFAKTGTSRQLELATLLTSASLDI